MTKPTLTEQQIDEEVIQEADDVTAWEFEATVEHPKAISLRLSPNLIKKLKLLAKLHNERGYQTLMKKWLSERVDTEIEMIRELKSKLKTINLDDIAK